MSTSEVLQRAEEDIDAEAETKKVTSRETHLDSNNWLDDNLQFLGQALQTNLQGVPTGTCTKFLSDKKTWCGVKASFQINTNIMFDYVIATVIICFFKMNLKIYKKTFKNSDRCIKHRNTDSSMINDMKRASEMERTQKVVICKNVYRTVVGNKAKNRFVRYCPSIEGATAAFRHSTNNLRKMLRAGFEVHRLINIEKRPFMADAFRNEFPNSEISDQKWFHSYQALLETLKSYNFNPNTDWTVYLPFLLTYLGAYQGWMDPKQSVPDEIFEDGLNDQKHLEFVNDLYTPGHSRGNGQVVEENPVVPAMNFRSDLNGLNTPSFDGGAVDIPSMNSYHPNTRWTREQRVSAIKSPTTPKPAPVMGELNNLIPPMYLDMDPNLNSVFETVVYIQAEAKTNPQLFRNKDVTNTAYDVRNDPAWHRRCDNAQYQILNIVRKEDGVHFPVKSINELKLRDSRNEQISQDYLDTMIDYLNGDRFIPGTEFSARNTLSHLVKGQNIITGKIKDGIGLQTSEDVRREQNRALHMLDKTALTMIKLANKMAEARVGVVYITSGTGFFNADVRRNACLLSEIPHAFFKQRQHFQHVVDHFGLQKERPRYMDYLDENTSIFMVTLKTHKGRHSIRRTSAASATPNPAKYTDEQRRFYQKTSNAVDICTNIASWMVLRKSESLPASEYVVALEGSPEVWSHWASMSNMCEDYFKRPLYNKDGTISSYKDRHGNVTTPTAGVGTFKKIAPFRSDCKQRIINAILELQTPNPEVTPLKMIRYPIEDGNAAQNVIQARSKTLQQKVSCFL